MKRLAALATVLGALAAPALAHAAPPIARPNPALVGIRLDYVSALPPPSTLAPLGPRVTLAATDDTLFLRFRQRDDLGGFMPAPVGGLALSSGGRDIHPHAFPPQIPLFARVAGDQVSSFLAGNDEAAAPDNGTLPVPGLGVPAPPPPPTPSNTVPPANQGFGGTLEAGGGGGGTTTTTTTRRAKPPTTTTTASTTTASTITAPATTAQSPTAGGSGGGGGAPGAGTCGIPGIQIDSSPPGCVITIGTAAPGDAVSEVMTITNTSGTTYTLSLRAEDANHDHLWSDLQMGVYPQFTPPPSPLPPLSYWTAQFNDLTVLAPGQTVSYVMVLYLPTTAGNADQGLTAVIGFHWQATG